MTTPRRAAGRGPDASTVRGGLIPVHLPDRGSISLLPKRAERSGSKISATTRAAIGIWDDSDIDVSGPRPSLRSMAQP
jgi:hypothetical protein